ncbi:MAG: autotransporter-associated beta strand repeat-containing protein [Planctomycetaceae bacterium]
MLSSISLTDGALTYTSTNANMLTVTLVGANYRFTDTENITATGAGLTGSGTMMVDVATADVTSISIDMGTTGSATIGGLTLSGDLSVTADTVTFNNGTVSSATTVTINADGPVINANASASLVAVAALDLVITTTGTGSAVGTTSIPITTSLGSLTVVTNDGGVFISDFNSGPSDSGLAISNVVVKENGFIPFVNGSNQVVVKASANDANPQPGTFDFSITAEGSIVLNTVTAPDAVSITATGGTIVDGNQAAGNILGRSVSLVAGQSVGQQPDPIEFNGETFSSSTTDGSIYLSEGIVGALVTVAAGGAGRDVEVTSSATTLRLGSITALGNVNLAANGGSIVDNNAGAVNIQGQKLVVSGKSGIGAASNLIETTVTEIDATASDAGAVIQIMETNGLSSVAVKTNDGNVNIGFTGGPLSFTASSDLLSAAGAAVTFENTGGGVSLGVVDAGSGAVSITSAAAIQDDMSDSAVDVRGGSVTLKAMTGIGAAGNEIDTDVATLTVTTTTGVIQIREANALSFSATGAGGDVDVRNATGNLTVNLVNVTGSVTLQSGGAILDGNMTANNIFGSSLTLTASNGIGTASDSIETSVGTLTANGGAGGGLFVANKRALVLTSASATGDNVSVTTIGSLTVNTVTATGRSATLTATGDVIDGNAGAVNVTASSVTLSGAKVGSSGDKLETNTASLSIATSAGGIFVSNSGSTNLTLSATASGQTADLDIDSTGNIVLDVAIAQGDLVKLAAAGAITDGNDTPTTMPINIIAKSLDISAPQGIGTEANRLELSVDLILNVDGGGAAAAFANDGPLAISEEALEAAGTGDLIFNADTITILDVSDNLAQVATNRSVVFRTQSGHIVFNDLADTIETQGTGSITVQAGLVTGSGGVAVLGNLRTAGTFITVTADKTITIGLLDAGTTGDVRVESRAGVIVDGNGSELNVIGRNANLIGSTPTLRQAEFDEITKVADAAGKRGEAAAKRTSFDSFLAASVISTAAEEFSINEVDEAQVAFDAAEAAAERQAAVVNGLSIAKTVADGIALATDIVATIAEAVADGAQAVPLTGDGGAATIAGVATVISKVASVAAFALDVALTIEDGKLGDLEDEQTGAQSELFAAESTLGLATATKNAFLEAVSISLAASIKADIARDAAARVSEQSTLARDQNNVMSTPDQPLGIRVSGIATLTAPNGDILLEVIGSVTVNEGALVLSEGAPDAVTLAGATVTLTLPTDDSIGSLAGVAGSTVILGENTLTTGGNDTDTSFAGVISGTGGVTKVGTGTFSLDGANTYTGATTVSAGRLDVNGSTAVGSTVTVEDTATLGGTGLVAGTTNVLGGGTVSTGNSPGVLRTATVTFNGGSTFFLDIAGTTPGNGDENYDQMVVTGNNRTTTLGGAELVFNLTVDAAVGQVFKIIDSTGTGSRVEGTFKYHGFTLNQGNVFTVDSTIFRINYNPAGASGDVTLTRIVGETLASLDNGTLTIADVGRVSTDRLTLSLDTEGNVLFHDPVNGIVGSGGVMSERVPLSELTQIVINTGVGADVLTIDFTNGNPIPSGGLVFNAAVGSSRREDLLVLNNVGAAISSVTYQPTNSLSGTLQLDTGSEVVPLSFTVLSMVSLEGTAAANLIFDLAASNESVTFTDLTGPTGVGRERFAGTGVAQVDFSVVGLTSLTVNGNNGNDTLKIGSLDSAFAAGVTLNGGDGNDVIDTAGSKTIVGRVATGVGTVQTGGIGDDKLTGGIGNDTLIGNEGRDVIKGGAGDDAILGGDGNDQLFGDAGNDTVSGGEDNDSILGGAGNDVLAGEGGRDTVKGEAGADNIAGGSGSGADEGDVVTDLAIDINEDLVLVFNDSDLLFEVMGLG